MLLLSHGADVSILNTEGHTPKTLAPSPVKQFLEGELLNYCRSKLYIWLIDFLF